MRTLKLRVRDQHISWLNQLARQINFVWNYVNELCKTHLERTGQFFSAFDLSTYAAGATKAGLSLHSQTIQAVTEHHVQKRRQFRKARLRWRISDRQSARYSLGWIPFKTAGIRYRNSYIKYAGRWLKLWDSYDIENYKIRTGCFVEDIVKLINY